MEKEKETNNSKEEQERQDLNDKNIPKVLVVDDSSMFRKRLKLILEEIGFEIAGEASDGKDAVEKYLELKPDVVLMDVVMPRFDGLWGVKEIIKNDPNSKIIMLSSLATKPNVFKAIKFGARSFIVKPFENTTLKKKIDYVVKTDNQKMEKGLDKKSHF